MPSLPCQPSMPNADTARHTEKLWRYFRRSGLVVLLCAVIIGLVAAFHPALAQSVTLDLGDGHDAGGFTAPLVQITVLITVLSLAPSLLIMVTSFTRLIVVLSLLRSAM